MGDGYDHAMERMDRDLVRLGNNTQQFERAFGIETDWVPKGYLNKQSFGMKCENCQEAGLENTMVDGCEVLVHMDTDKEHKCLETDPLF